MNKYHIFCNFDTGNLHKNLRKFFVIFVHFDEEKFYKNY